MKYPLFGGAITRTSKDYVNDDIITTEEIKQEIYKVSNATSITIPNSQITRLRDNAIELIENLIETSLVNSTYNCKLYGFHNYKIYYVNSIGFIIDKKYLRSIEQIEYTQDEVVNVFDVSNYILEKKDDISNEIKIKNPNSLPKVDSYSYSLMLGAVSVDFKAGLFLDVGSVDAIIKSAIMDFVKNSYEGCSESKSVSLLKTNISKYLVYC